MNIKISVYNTQQFKKHGSLKKSARAERGFMIADVEPIKEADKKAFFKDASEQLKKDYCNFASPYVFAYITANRKSDGEPVCIFENVGEFMTTPKTLLELLQK